MRLRILKLFGNWLEKQVHVGLTFLKAPDHLTLSCQPHRPGARLVSSKGSLGAASGRAPLPQVGGSWLLSDD